MSFSRQEYWSGLPFPSPGDLPDPGIKPGSPVLQALPMELYRVKIQVRAAASSCPKPGCSHLSPGSANQGSCQTESLLLEPSEALFTPGLWVFEGGKLTIAERYRHVPLPAPRSAPQGQSGGWSCSLCLEIALGPSASSQGLRVSAYLCPQAVAWLLAQEGT